MVARPILVRVVHAPLKHLAVHGAGSAGVLAGNYPHPVAALEAVLGLMVGSVENGHAGWL